MTAGKQIYSLWDDLERFDLGDSGAIPSEWKGKKALYLEKMNSAVFLRNEVKYNYFRLQAEMAIPGEAGFIGLVFGAKDHGNYELMYLAPVEIQYDPVINGSLTWSQLNIAARLFYVELQLCEAFVPLGAVLHAEASQTFT